MFSGNITLDPDGSIKTMSIDMKGPEGWNCTISPDEITAYFMPATVQFEAIATPTPNAEQGNHNVSIIFIESGPWPSEIYRRIVTCRVIQNRIE